MQELQFWHPLSVHVPVALIVFGTLCTWMSIWRPAPFSRLALALLAAAIPALLLAGQTGVETTSRIYDLLSSDAARQTLDDHARWADRIVPLAALALIGIILAERLHNPAAITMRPAAILMKFVAPVPALALLVYVGQLGGRMVYQYGALSIAEVVPTKSGAPASGSGALSVTKSVTTPTDSAQLLSNPEAGE